MQVRAFVRDERGTVAILTAVSLITLVGVAALAVDIGSVYLDRRRAQSAADLAALAAAADLANAGRAARATVQQNRFGAETSVDVALGVYTPDRSVAPVSRFNTAASGAPNAVRVTMRTLTPLFFGRALTGSDNFEITTTAVATSTALASIAIGSRLATVDGGLINQVLGGLLGTSLSLSAMDYRSLLDARVDVFEFLSALATRASISGPTYESVLAANVRPPDLVRAMADALRASGASSAATRALTDIATAVAGSTNSLSVGSLIAAGPYQTMSPGQKPKTSVEVAAMDMLTAIAQIANGQRQVEVGLALTIPGIASASLRLAVGERPVGTSWLAVGPVGVSVHTAQTRVLLTVRLLGAGSIAEVSLPVYVEIASASAQVTGITCRYNNPDATTVTLSARPSVVDAWIGAVSMSEFGNFAVAPNPPAAALVDTALLRVTGRAHATMTNLTARTLTFNRSEIAQAVKKTIGTEDFVASLLSRLIGDLSVNASILGLGLGLPGPIAQSVSGIVANAASPLDQLLSQVLTTLGVGLGQADVWVNGVRCDGAVLVI